MKKAILFTIVLASILGFISQSALAVSSPYYSVNPTTDTVIIDPSSLDGAVGLSQDDDGCTYVGFNGASFEFYGVSWGGVWVNNNGNLTLGGADGGLGGYLESIPDFLAPEPRVGVFWDDLNPYGLPAESGVFANVLSDRLVVTWKDVPEYWYGGSNTFQITLEFATGNIIMNFDSMTSVDSIVGIGPGPGHVYNGPVDFSAILGIGGAVFGVNEAILEQYDDSSNNFDLLDTSLVFSHIFHIIGKANFGFVSKYKKGVDVPTGRTEFQFHVADLNFHSDNYDWLLVTGGGDTARFKGEGTINGANDENGNPYKFMIWAKDDPDTFRIRIWSEDDFGVETDVYDNGFDQAISGGSIIIHSS